MRVVPSSSRAVQRLVGGVGVLAPAVLVAGMLLSPAAHADTSTADVPPNALTPLPESAPNVFYGDDHYKPSNTWNYTNVFADPVNHHLFETNVQKGKSSSWTCPPSNDPSWNSNTQYPLVELDIDTYQVLNKGCGGGAPDQNANGATSAAVVAVDSADDGGLLFVTDGGSSSTPIATDSIIVISERDLHVVGVWPLPNDALRTVYGMSWYAPTDQLLVETAYPDNASSPATSASNEGLPGVVIATIDIHANLGAAAPNWLPSIKAPPACSYPLTYSGVTGFGLANPVRSTNHPWLFVPCNLQGSFYLHYAGQMLPGVVRVDLDGNGQPTGTSAVTVAPGSPGAFMFDPDADRGYLPYQSNSGSEVEVYDGTLPAFVGAAAFASAPEHGSNPDSNAAMVAADPNTGRVYAVGPAGMVTIDGRTDPVQPGTTYTEYGHPAFIATMPVLPPDSVYPFPRVLVNYCYKDGQFLPTGSNTRDGAIQAFTVYADTIPVGGEATGYDVDQNTLQGPPPAGATLMSDLGASASAVGARMLWPGSYGGVVNNQTGGGYNANNLPMGAGTRDLLAGWVQGADLSNSSTDATTTAIGDGNHTTTDGSAQCTDLAALAACSNPPSPNSLGSGVNNPPSDYCHGLANGNTFLQPAGPACDSIPDPSGLVPQLVPGGGDPQQALSQAPNTGQVWPFPIANCSQPGSTTTNRSITHNSIYLNSEKTDANGAYVTTSRDSHGAPVIQQVPGSDNGATAHADCLVEPPKPSQSGSSPSSASSTSDTGSATPSYGVLASAQVHALNAAPASGPTVSVAYAGGIAKLLPSTTIGEPTTAQASAVSEGVRITLPGGVVIDIGEVYQEVSAQATGLASGASGRRLVQFADVAVTTPQSGRRSLCQSEADCSTDMQEVVHGLNQIDPANLHVEIPAPDTQFGDPTPDSSAHDGSVIVPGSPGGYEAGVRASQVQQNYDRAYNAMPNNDRENALLPALRITLDYDDAGIGRYEIDRQVIDLAAVSADTHDGILALVPFTLGNGDNGGTSTGTASTATGSKATPGTPARVIPAKPGHFVPGNPGQFVAGTPGHFVGGLPAAQTTPTSGGPPLVAPLVHWFKRTLKGLSLAFRSPGAALKFFGLLLLLLAPVLLMVRRQQWLRQVYGGAA